MTRWGRPTESLPGPVGTGLGRTGPCHRADPQSAPGHAGIPGNRGIPGDEAIPGRRSGPKIIRWTGTVVILGCLCWLPLLIMLRTNTSKLPCNLRKLNLQIQFLICIPLLPSALCFQTSDRRVDIDVERVQFLGSLIVRLSARLNTDQL